MYCLIRCEEDLMNDPNIAISYGDYYFKSNHLGSLTPASKGRSVFLNRWFPVVNVHNRYTEVDHPIQGRTTVDNRFISKYVKEAYDTV